MTNEELSMINDESTVNDKQENGLLISNFLKKPGLSFGIVHIFNFHVLNCDPSVLNLIYGVDLCVLNLITGFDFKFVVLICGFDFSVFSFDFYFVVLTFEF